VRNIMRTSCCVGPQTPTCFKSDKKTDKKTICTNAQTHLLLRGCEDHGCIVQAALLAFDAPADLVALLDLCLGHGACGQHQETELR